MLPTQTGTGAAPISLELQYVALLFVLFIFPRVLQRYRLPSAFTCLGLGALASIGFRLFQHDPGVSLLSTLGIVSLFLFAGLDVEFSELRRNAAILTQHLVIRISLLTLVTFLVELTLGLPVQPSILVSLALTTPSTGFILDSLGSLGVSQQERAWIKSKAIATELVALVVLFIALQPPSATVILRSSVILVAMIAFLPLIFRLFAKMILPHAPKSEFGFLVMAAVLCALITRELGAYYLVGAFVVGVTAQRFRRQLPAIASEQIVHAVELFASFFVPFYFFHAGLGLRSEDFTPAAIALGFMFIAILIPGRVYLVALHRRLSLGESVRSGARIGISIAPTLVFTLVIAEILRDRFAVSPVIFGGLIVYTLVNTLLPGFILRSAPRDGEAKNLLVPEMTLAAPSGEYPITSPDARG
jgi:Kef-type K+ transport system membrane component KefB